MSKSFGFFESFSHEHVFADKFQVRNNDGDWSEQSLESLRKFCSSKISWIHSDKSTASWV